MPKCRSRLRSCGARAARGRTRPRAGAPAGRRSARTRPSSCMRIQASHVVSWMKTVAPRGASPLRYSAAALWVVNPQNWRFSPSSAPPAVPPTSGHVRREPERMRVRRHGERRGEGARRDRQPPPRGAVDQRAPGGRGASRSRRARSRDPRGAREPGTRASQCLVAPKMGVFSRKNGPTDTANERKSRRSVSAASRAPPVAPDSPNFAESHRRARSAAFFTRSMTPIPKRASVTDGTVAATITGR